jgi:hypothetical protein
VQCTERINEEGNASLEKVREMQGTEDKAKMNPSEPMKVNA